MQVLAELGFSAQELNQVEFLCNSLDNAGSGVLLTSHCGLDDSMGTLIPCIDLALRVQACTADECDAVGSADGISHMNPWHRAQHGPTIIPSVVVIVADQDKAKAACRAFNDWIIPKKMPLAVRDYSFGRYQVFGRTPTPWQPNAADIAVFTPAAAARMFSNNNLRLERLRLLVCDEAHSMLGPVHRKTVAPFSLYRHHVYNVLADIRAANQNALFLLTGPQKYSESMAVIGKEVLQQKPPSTTINVGLSTVSRREPTQAPSEGTLQHEVSSTHLASRTMT